MGNTTSLEQMEPDPWWEPSQAQQDNIQNVLSREIETSATRLCENTNWQQRELAMGQTIQHLAEENMRLAVAKRTAEQKMEETRTELEADTHLSEELDKLRNEAEKNKQVFEKLHAQIQSGREDRQMITLEMERIRCGFDAEREAKEQAFVELSKLREERDEKKREIESINEKLSYEKKIIEEVTATLNQERVEKECVTIELEKLREELQSLKSLTVDISEQQKLQDVEGPVGTRIRSPEARAEMERFQAEMNTRREVRQRVMQAVSSEIERLKTELNNEREARQQATQQLEQALLHTCSNVKTKPEETLTAELEKLQQKMKGDRKKLKQVTQENERLQFELENQKQILTEKTNDLEKLQLQLESERESTQYQIDALKEVGAISKQMLMIRENQVLQLKKNLTQIETSVTNRKHEKITEDLKTEYESQMENMRSLKGLYEERMKAMLSEKEKLVHDSEEKSQLLDAELKKSAEFEHQIEEMKLSLSEKEEENSNLQIQLDDSQDKSHGLAKELSLINNLFTQMLVGNTATDMDLDKLTKLLQENHDLITEITIRENCSEAAARLPKLLLDLVMQVDSGTASTSSSPTGERGEENEDLPIDDEVIEDVQGVENKNSSEECVNGMAVEDIALNLPKVWKVLMELLSHHITPSVVGDHEDTQNSCYKSVDTPSGPRLAISVSKTFLRLKDLILEKKSLQKELTRLKQLNGHLERKLNDQEQKLSVVSSELQKTWNVVDRMQTQHQQLHTHEKILRYELHEKRTLLTELKQELEYCREKWERARQKNSESEVEWRKLRKEFASRKNKPMNSLNNSGESGFADERGEDSCEEDKDTGQLDPGIDLNAGIYKPPSPVTDLPQPDILLNPSEVNCDVPLEQTGLLCSEPALSEINVTQVPQSVFNHAELLSQSESELLLDLQPDTFPHSDSQNNRNEDTCDPSSIQLKSESNQEGIPDCRLEPTDSNCSTISLITLLKQQLSFFSRNLTEEVDDISGHNLQALESIFSLPPIQIPKSINDNIIKQNYNEQRAFMTYFGQENSPLLSPSVSPALPKDNETANTSCSDHGADHQIVSTEKNGSPSASCISKEMISTSRCSSDISDREDGFVTPSTKNNSSSILHSDSESPKTSGTVPTNTSRTAEEIAEARAARLKRLEEQCQQLYNKVTRTTHRSTALCNRLEELHEQYRSSDNSPGPGDGSQSECNIPIPPPLPQDLRGRRIPTTSEETSPSTISTSSPPFLNTVEASQGHTSLNLIEKEASETGNVPSPLSFPHDQYPRQNPTYQNSTEIQVIVHIPTPPPFPENLRGIRLPTCSSESQRISVSLDSTTQRAIETTIQRIPSNVQSQEELSQESDISSSSSNMTKETDK